MKKRWADFLDNLTLVLIMAGFLFGIPLLMWRLFGNFAGQVSFAIMSICFILSFLAR